MLDQLPPSRHEIYVRQLLVHTGVLPERLDDLERLPAWLEQILADRPDAHGRLVRPFVHWFLLLRARRRAAARLHPATANGYLKTRILAALALLTWLDEQNQPLGQLDQPALEIWLSQGTSSSYTIRYFLGWAADRGLARRLAVPLIARHDPALLLDEDRRWTLLRRCLTEDSLPLEVRATGALLLLFGLPVSRIRHLTVDQLRIDGDHGYLTVGQQPLLLPPRLADLLSRLAAVPHSRQVLAHGGSEQRWLFPGLVPGRPTSQADIGGKLARHGIPARAARNAALFALAGSLPTSVLADLLGVSITTAVYWAGLAGKDWQDYIAARAGTPELEAGASLMPADRHTLSSAKES